MFLNYEQERNKTCFMNITLSKAWSASFKFLVSFTFKLNEFFQHYKASVVELIFIWNYICMQYFYEMA